MARTDQERWDQRYRDGDWVDSDSPSPIVEDAVPWLSPPGRALDVACGSGRNSLFLARFGFEAIAVDLSWRGLHLLAKRARSERLGVHPVRAPNHQRLFVTSGLHGQGGEQILEILRQEQGGLPQQHRKGGIEDVA